MIENRVTLSGNVVAEPRLRCLADGTFAASFRIASTPRWFDRGSGSWREGETVFVTVNCWRSLAGNVGDSVRKGDPVLVSGRLTARSWATADGERRSTLEIEAAGVGHDLNRVVTTVSRSRRMAAQAADSDGPNGAARPAGSPAEAAEPVDPHDSPSADVVVSVDAPAADGSAGYPLPTGDGDDALSPFEAGAAWDAGEGIAEGDSSGQATAHTARTRRARPSAA